MAMSGCAAPTTAPTPTSEPTPAPAPAPTPSPTPTTPTTKPGEFPDENLEAAIRYTISKFEGPIYSSDLQGLATLDGSDISITDLTGLEYCANLIKLRLNKNQISDLSPLANLTNLIELSLEENQIGDISPLVENSGLGAGTMVDLLGNPLSTTSLNDYIPQLEERGAEVKK